MKKYYGADDILKFKAAEKAAPPRLRGGCLTLLAIITAVILFLPIVVATMLSSAPQSPTTLPSPTPYPTYNPPATAVPYPTYNPPATAVPYPTYTPYPTYAPLSTYAPLPTLTPAATYTPPATATPYPTYTPYPTLPAIAVMAAQQQAVRNVAEMRTVLVVVIALALAMFALSVAAVGMAWRQRPLAAQQQPVIITDPSPTAQILPPPTWEPVREVAAPVQEPVTPVSPPDSTGAGREIPLNRGVGEPGKITVSVRPADAGVDVEQAREIIRKWNEIERPSYNAVCEQHFGSKNSARLALVKRAIQWGREQGEIE